MVSSPKRAGPCILLTVSVLLHYIALMDNGVLEITRKFPSIFMLPPRLKDSIKS